LRWEKLPAWWQANIAGSTTRSMSDDGITYRIFRVSQGFQLWVWSGPNEDGPVFGMMGADLRSQKRAQRLGCYARLSEAKKVATRLEATR
jgi:hypothetical protein